MALRVRRFLSVSAAVLALGWASFRGLGMLIVWLSLLIFLPIIVGASCFGGFLWAYTKAEREFQTRLDKVMLFNMDENGQLLMQLDEWHNKYSILIEMQNEMLVNQCLVLCTSDNTSFVLRPN